MGIFNKKTEAEKQSEEREKILQKEKISNQQKKCNFCDENGWCEIKDSEMYNNTCCVFENCIFMKILDKVN